MKQVDLRVRQWTVTWRRPRKQPAAGWIIDGKSANRQALQRRQGKIHFGFLGQCGDFVPAKRADLSATLRIGRHRFHGESATFLWLGALLRSQKIPAHRVGNGKLARRHQNRQ